MSINELIRWWDKSEAGPLTEKRYEIHLPVEQAAMLRALSEMYTKRSIEQIITDLLSAALHDLETSLPYQPGNRVIAEDEFGDPMYEDVGPTPQFLSLTKKHVKALKAVRPGEHH